MKELNSQMHNNQLVAEIKTEKLSNNRTEGDTEPEKDVASHHHWLEVAAEAAMAAEVPNKRTS